MCALSQGGQACSLQGPSLRGFPDDGGVEGLHVAPMQLIPLLRSEGFRTIFLMTMRRAAIAIAAATATETRRAAWRVNHQDFHRRVTAVALG